MHNRKRWMLLILIVCSILVAAVFAAPNKQDISEQEEVISEHTAFHFNFALESNIYSHIEATCVNGMLFNLQAPEESGEKTIRLEQDQQLCWATEIVEDSTAELDEISFTIFSSEEVVFKGNLKIVQTGEEGGPSFLEAQLVDTELLTAWQEEEGKETHVAMAGNGTIISYSDFNHNRINERVIVRETEPQMLYELLVVENGDVIWKAEAGLPHVGWNTIMKCNTDEGSYLVQYLPTMYQGLGSYRCRMFSLENNVETLVKEWVVDFVLPVGETLKMTPEMEVFKEEIDLLLRNCDVLLSTEQGILVNQYTSAIDIPQIYPVRFHPDEIWEDINGNGDQKELTTDAAKFPDKSLNFMYASGAGGWGS